MFVHQIDVNTAYLHAHLDEAVYMQEPKGFVTNRTKCWRLLKSIYGLRSSSLNWYNTLNQMLIDLGFTRINSDNCVYFKILNASRRLILGVYVDDILIIGNELSDVEEFKLSLSVKLSISDKGCVKQFLGLDINYDQSNKILTMNMHQYINQMLEDFEMTDVKPKKLPVPVDTDFDLPSDPLPDTSIFMSMLGRMIYLSKVMPSIRYSVNRLCAYMQTPTTNHLNIIKHILKYLKFIQDTSIKYTTSDRNELDVYCDANFNELDSKSITGVCVLLYGNLVGFKSKKQTNVSTSTTQSELNAVYDATTFVVYISYLLLELKLNKNLIVSVLNDNQSTLHTINTSGDFDVNKHYIAKVNLVREVLSKNNLALKYINTESNLADIFTKALNSVRIRFLLNEMKVV